MCFLFLFFSDLFDKVVPLAIHQALAMFENRKSEVLNREIGRLREATQLLNRFVFVTFVEITLSFLTSFEFALRLFVSPITS